MEKVLIVYYSWSTRTQIFANLILDIVGGDLFPIKEKEVYTKDYNEVVKQAKKEIKKGYLPELIEDIDISKYDTVFIGSPNWWGTMAPPVLSFIKKHDFTNKKVIPYCTHGGGGEQSVLKDISLVCKERNAEIIEKGLCLFGNSINSSNDKIKQWINNIK